MAYDQGYYQPPQRPYNGRAAQPPAAAYNRAPPQQYPPPQEYGQPDPYDQYSQDQFAYDDNANGNAQQYDNQYQQPMNGGGRGGGGGGGGGRGQYPPQNQGYPPPQQQNPQKDYYDNRGGGGGGGGGGGSRQPPQNRQDGRGGPAPFMHPPRSESRNGFDSRGGGPPRGYPNGNGPAMGRGGRPVQLERAGSSDPGQSQRGPPPGPQPMSPQELAWDTPFPAFPGAKKKTSRSEEQSIVQQMGDMDLGAQSNDPRRPRTAGGDSRRDNRRPGPPQEGYGRPSGDRQRPGAPRDFPPQQQGNGGGSAQRRPAPGPAQSYDRSQGNGYDNIGYNDQGYGSASTPTSPTHGGFGPDSRSMTMPTNMDAVMGGNPRFAAADGPGPSAPYNGPVGRMPPRPSTATGARPPPQQTYASEPPEQAYGKSPSGPSHQQMESISDLYDAYYDHPTSHDRNGSVRSDGANYDAFPLPGGDRRGMSIDDNIGSGRNGIPPRQQVNGYSPPAQMKVPADSRAKVQSQSAVYEMAGEAPAVPNAYPQQGRGQNDERYNQYGNQPPPHNGQGGRGYAGNDQGGPMMPPPRSNSLPQNNSLPSNTAGGLPAHPTPIRAGLIPNSVANQANNRPPPVRNYDNTPPAAAPQTAPPAPPGPSPSPVPFAAAPPVTAVDIEYLKSDIKAKPNDQNLQLALARKYILAADHLAPLLPDPKQRIKMRERYVMDAHKMLKKLVALGNTDSMFFLADCYGRGSLGLETDNKEAFSLYQSAAKAGHAAAAYRTAVCCELGNEEGGGTRKDPLKAIQWYKRAATLGDTPAMYKMGMIQLKGLLGQPKNPREAIVWLKRAAERADAENPHALHELGLLYESQQPLDSIVRDEAYSFSLFTKAAELGYKFSQFRLGSAYEYGLFNLPIDPRLSILWYSRAAVQEEHQSELALSGWYLTGATEAATGKMVLQQSDTEAYLWARKAAMAGLAKAEYAMGYFTEVGIGAPSDFEGAKRWYWRAAAQNFPKARERLEDLKKGGSKPQLKARERISRSKVGKQNEGECAVM